MRSSSTLVEAHLLSTISLHSLDNAQPFVASTEHEVRREPLCELSCLGRPNKDGVARVQFDTRVIHERRLHLAEPFSWNGEEILRAVSNRSLVLRGSTRTNEAPALAGYNLWVRYPGGLETNNQSADVVIVVIQVKQVRLQESRASGNLSQRRISERGQQASSPAAIDKLWVDVVTREHVKELCPEKPRLVNKTLLDCSDEPVGVRRIRVFVRDSRDVGFVPHDANQTQDFPLGDNCFRQSETVAWSAHGRTSGAKMDSAAEKPARHIGVNADLQCVLASTRMPISGQYVYMLGIIHHQDETFSRIDQAPSCHQVSRLDRGVGN
mmetsp:Transcript_36016/g.82008  ORF Transcript_36016/g.82008 Transcript_36016/m.82008 type:complete len:324 (-) Transcript_36016:496-1467(-)